ncbi:MAG TPA: 3-dehydroquinate synthase [Candidatus Acidoferrales bacterium]|nr:3-dehydroquinate synthase [Candidatus Acidoferrales bacterium]
MKRVLIHSSAGDYPLLCGRGLVRRRGWLVGQLPADRTGVYLLSSPRVWRHWGRALGAAFGGAAAKPLLFDDRESSKNLRTVERISRALVRARADRGAVLVAAGGGVVGDVAGFVAAAYMRGVRLVHVPTTLVAQVDSAIGGKTGVNLPEGKNLVGAFYPPQLVVADPELLGTLGERQFRSGLYEVAKYAIIGDPRLFAILERAGERIASRDPAALDWVVARCARIKAEVAGRDEREMGLRQILNFGHTVGHALEAATGYRRLLHGEAVGWGMLAALEIARRSGRLAAADARRAARLIAGLGPLPALPPAALRRTMARTAADKKARGGRLRWVLPRSIGEVEITDRVSPALVRAVIAALPRLVPSAALSASPLPRRERR